MTGFVRSLLVILTITITSASALHTYGQDGDRTVYDMYLDNLVKDKDKAMNICEIYLSGIDSTRETSHTASLCDSLAQWYEEKYQFTKAIGWRERALEIYTREGMAGEEADIKYKLARLSLKKDLYHKTLIYAYDAARYYKDAAERDKELDCYNLLGIVYHICMDFDQSAQYFECVAKDARQYKDTARLVGALNNSALLAGTLGDTLKAESLAQESVRLSQAIQDSSLLCQCYLNLASQYIVRGMYDEASDALDMADKYLKGIDKAGDWHRICGMMYASEDSLDQAADELEKAVLYYTKGEFSARLLFCQDMLYTIYEMDGDYENAFRALEEYHKIDKATSYKNVYFELFRAQNDIINKDEQQKLEDDRNRQRIARICVGFILTIAVLVVWYLLKRKTMRIKQKEDELKTKELINENKQQEIRSKKEILEIKQMQQYKIDKIVKEVMEKLGKLSGTLGDGPAKDEINILYNDLKNTREENSWKEISLYVPEFNSDFFNDLMKTYPNLSVNERRLLALLNMNMTTKDIAKITMQSPHSINIARYRLRAKLGLTGSDKSIQEFLSEYRKKETDVP